MSYIQVGMKNKKYFLAIFPFITIFLGHMEERIVMFGRGSGCEGSGERLMRTIRECFDFKDKGIRCVKKAVKRYEGGMRCLQVERVRR